MIDATCDKECSESAASQSTRHTFWMKWNLELLSTNNGFLWLFVQFSLMTTRGKDLHNLPPLKLERGAKLSLSKLLSARPRPRTTPPTTSPWSPWTPSPWSAALRSASSLFFFHSLFFSILSWAFNKSDRHHPQQHRHHLQRHQNLHWQHFHPHHHPSLDYQACALRALGLLLADGTPTVGGGKTFWAVSQIFLRKQL